MKESTSARVLMTKKLLRLSLFELIKDKPITRISIKEICEKAGVNRSTFYNYYYDEYAVLADIEKEVFEEMNTHLGDKTLAREDYMVDYLRYIHSNIDRLRPLFFTPDCKGFKNFFFHGTEQYIRSLKDLVPSATTPFLISYITNGNWAIILKWIEEDFPISEESLSEILFNYCKYLLH